ncbi:MAG TPA: LptA/OstA family protein [Opitutaceae bacterium]|nr:LptA/OstA family protein [Opitutaceae bacterium]
MKTAPVLALAAALATAACAAETPQQKTVLTAAHSDFQTVGEETHFVFDGAPGRQVTLIGTNLKILCDHLEITTVGIGDNSSALPAPEKFKYLLATGHVNIVQGDREATSGRAEVFPRENKIELTEKPVVDDHGNGWHGTGAKITMYRGDRRVVIEDSTFEGPSIKDLGFDKDQPPPAPNSPPQK